MNIFKEITGLDIDGIILISRTTKKTRIWETFYIFEYVDNDIAISKKCSSSSSYDYFQAATIKHKAKFIQEKKDKNGRQFEEFEGWRNDDGWQAQSTGKYIEKIEGKSYLCLFLESYYFCPILSEFYSENKSVNQQTSKIKEKIDEFFRLNSRDWRFILFPSNFGFFDNIKIKKTTKEEYEKAKDKYLQSLKKLFIEITSFEFIENAYEALKDSYTYKYRVHNSFRKTIRKHPKEFYRILNERYGDKYQEYFKVKIKSTSLIQKNILQKSVLKHIRKKVKRGIYLLKKEQKFFQMIVGAVKINKLLGGRNA